MQLSSTKVSPEVAIVLFGHLCFRLTRQFSMFVLISFAVSCTGMDYNVIIIIPFLHVVDVLAYFPRSPSDSLFVYITVWGELALLYSSYDRIS